MADQVKVRRRNKKTVLSRFERVRDLLVRELEGRVEDQGQLGGMTVVELETALRACRDNIVGILSSEGGVREDQDFTVYTHFPIGKKGEKIRQRVEQDGPLKELKGIALPKTRYVGMRKKRGRPRKSDGGETTTEQTVGSQVQC